jgi:hypothetical protein
LKRDLKVEESPDSSVLKIMLDNTF